MDTNAPDSVQPIVIDPLQMLLFDEAVPAVAPAAQRPPAKKRSKSQEEAAPVHCTSRQIVVSNPGALLAMDISLKVSIGGHGEQVLTQPTPSPEAVSTKAANLAVEVTPPAAKSKTLEQNAKDKATQRERRTVNGFGRLDTHIPAIVLAAVRSEIGERTASAMSRFVTGALERELARIKRLQAKRQLNATSQSVVEVSTPA